MKKFFYLGVLFFSVLLTHVETVKAQNKFELSVDGHYQYNSKATDEKIIGLNVTGGYRIFDFCRIGIGTGLGDVMSNSSVSATQNEKKKNVLYIPFVGQVKVNFLKKCFSPYVGVEGGGCYYFANDSEKFGSTLKLFLGLDIPIAKSLNAYCQLGYNSQSICRSYTLKGGYTSPIGYSYPMSPGSYGYPDQKFELKNTEDLIVFAAGLTYLF